ncbi:unnamed protein product [Cuscuta campestris]|uniref:Uncharacterized protein n=1 Tax=Cuscuta campestris TaxID=132261 RepID=A0A484MDH7_9ASTE|nr:unnamed protein product [Cuscuta campestris]
MRRASSSALLLLRRRPLSSLVSSSVSDAAASQFHPYLKHLTQTPPFLSRHANTPRMFNTQTPPQYSEDMLKAGMDDLNMGTKLHREGKHEKALSFATRALQSFYIDEDSASLPLALALHLIGSVSCALERFDDSLGYLNWAKLVLGKLEKGESCSYEHIISVEHVVEDDLYNTNTAMGRRVDALAHLMKSVELKEKIWGEGSLELGFAYREVALAHICALKFSEALPFCLKALEIHKALLGENSVAVADDRELLGTIYGGLLDDEKALEQKYLLQKVLTNLGRGQELLRVEVDTANCQIRLGRYDEAINTLKGVLPLTDKDNTERANVYVSMSKAFSGLVKLEESKMCLDNACAVLGKDESSFPYGVAVDYMEISSLYEAMDDFENALSVSKKALAMFEKMPEAKNCAGNVSCNIGVILLSTGKAEQAIPYLEDAAKWLKESYGSKHFIVSRVYKALGNAYLELDRPQAAVQVFADAAQVIADAKDMLDVYPGVHHALSIKADQNLSKAYAAMGSYELAIKFQKKVVEALEGLGPDEEDKLEDAREVLEQLEMKKASHAPVEEAKHK